MADIDSIESIIKESDKSKKTSKVKLKKVLLEAQIHFLIPNSGT